MSDPFSTLIKGVTQSVTNTANQAAQTANDVAEGAAKSLNEFTSSMDKEMDDVGKAAKEGNFAKAFIEGTELFSPGSMGAAALKSTGFLPDDPVVNEIASGAINFMMGNPFGALKDLGDAFGAMSAGGSRGGQPAAPHTPQRPARAYEAARANVSASANVGVRAGGGYASVSINVSVDAGRGGNIRPGCGAPAWKGWMGQNPLIMQSPAQCLANHMRGAIEGALRDAGAERTGPPCRDKPMSDRGISDILNDPTLCFEDMVAMVMAKVCSDMQDQVRDQIEKLDQMTASKDAKSSGADAAKGGGGTDGTAAGGGSAGGAAASGAAGGAAAEGGPLGMLGGGGGGPADMLFMAVDAIAFGPIGMIIGSGLSSGSVSKELLGSLDPKMIGGIVEGAKGLAPVLAPLVAGACAGFPPIGTIIAPFVPMLLPVVLDLAGGALESAAGAAQQGGGTQGGAAAQGSGGAREGRDAEARNGAKSSARGAPDPQATAPGKGVGGMKEAEGAEGGEKADQNSISLEMEKLKLLMQRMQEMQQAMSNVLNNMHEGAMNSIRNIK